MPVAIRPLLFKYTNNDGEWYNFLQNAKEYVWIAFTDQIKNKEIEINMSNDVFAMKKSFVDKKRSQSYNKNSKTCVLHGKQEHSTSECKLMDELKREGVKVFYDRKKFGVNMMNVTENISDDEENINKINESYL
ncbi:hypothetical protein COBT_002625, partial [Conglomerata obtusa]